MASHRWTATVVACAVLSGCGSAVAAPPPAGPAPSVTTARPSKAPPKAVPIRYPQHGNQDWTVAPAQTAAPSGTSGKLWRYRVRIEKDITGVPLAAFAETVRRTLGDPRGWTAGDRRFRRVGPGQDYDFVVSLVTPDTRDALCDDVPDGYTSCRNGADVVLNVARWAKGVPGFGKNLTWYRTYMINHETGHRLGYGHEKCPGAGRPAPVMEQQTLGLHGCTPQPWPYPNGEHYQGPPGAYGDQVPAA